MQHLKFRRQFLLTDDLPDNIPKEWELTCINFENKTWNLFSHPDLEITSANNNTFRLILIGYFVNPFHPDLDNKGILEELILQPDADRMVEKTHVLNGRFLLLFISKDDFIIFNDATCFRELFYLIDNSKIYCGSTPDIIRNFIGVKFSKDREIISFLDSEAYKSNDNTWIGYETIFTNLRKLPPNFSLDIKTQSIKRFWPLKPFEKRKADDIVVESAEYLQGCLHSILKRYPVHLGITAGWESRLLLAMSKNVKDKVFYFVNINTKINKAHPDLRIPKILSKRLGFKLNIIQIENLKIDQNFRKIYFSNNFRANEKLLPVFYYGYENQFDHTITVSGNLGEGIARNYFYSPMPIDSLDSVHFLKFVNFGKNHYTERVMDSWIKEAKVFCKELNINIFDFYQIEMESTNWCNLSSSEQDIVREEMRPFNSRYLINLFWSIGDQYKFKYNPRIYKMIIRYLWKETLKVPFNPSFKNSVIRILGIFKLDIFIYKIFLRIKYGMIYQSLYNRRS